MSLLERLDKSIDRLGAGRFADMMAEGSAPGADFGALVRASAPRGPSFADLMTGGGGTRFSDLMTGGDTPRFSGLMDGGRSSALLDTSWLDDLSVAKAEGAAKRAAKKKGEETIGSPVGQGAAGPGYAPSTGLSAGVAPWADRTAATFGDLGADMPDTMLAIMENESGGQANAYNAAGDAWGLFQMVGLGTYDLDRQFSAAKQLAQQKLAAIAQSYAANGLSPDERTRARDVALAWAGHFDYATGLPNPTSKDVGSGQTAAQLSAIFLANYDRIKAGKRQAAAAGPTNYQGGQPLAVLFGGTNPTVMQPFGETDYSRSHPSTYRYGNDYGLAGSQHPGVDYGMPYGTALYIPVGGKVIYAGGTGYFRNDPRGDGPGSGELRIRLANGDEIILGHMSRIDVSVGQTVNAGLLAGLSGGSDGDHLHLEVRRLNANGTYTIVDPRIYFAAR
jgi:murein DD-endopeptidase MepM/ murein hydrolase activator NlpD